MYFVHRVFAWALLMNVLCLFVDISDTALSGRTDQSALDVDDDGDGKVSALELEAHLDRIEAYGSVSARQRSLPPRRLMKSKTYLVVTLRGSGD